MSSAGRPLQVTTTTPAEELAQRIAESAVAERLAACAQVHGPIQSTFRWQGELDRATEWSCVLKTTAGRYPALEARIRALHPYEVPEIVATEVTGSDAYLRWIQEAVT
jgi:periplasmic divalent cation tolerance protein